MADNGGQRGSGRGTVESAGGAARPCRGAAATEGEPEPDPEPDAEPRLGTILQLEARQAGHEQDWRAYVAGRLLIPHGGAPSFGLLAEPVPRDAAEAAAVAARWRVDPDLLWLVVKTATRRVRGKSAGAERAMTS